MPFPSIYLGLWLGPVYLSTYSNFWWREPDLEVTFTTGSETQEDLSCRLTSSGSTCGRDWEIRQMIIQIYNKITLKSVCQISNFLP